jgi:hypothetical protein
VTGAARVASTAEVGRWGPLVEVLAVTAAVAVSIAVGDLVGAWGGVWGSLGALVAGGAMLGVPLAVARLRRLDGDILAVDPPLGRALFAGVAVSLVILPLFALGHDLLQTRAAGLQRGQGVGLQSAGWQVQGEPPDPIVGVLVREGRGGLVVENRSPLTVTLVSAEPQSIRPQRRVLLPWSQVQGATLRDAAGQPVAALGGAAAVPLDQPLDLPRGWSWLATLLLVQLAAVALPEELCFRGYVLGRLRAVWPARRRLFGVPFGAAHVTSAGLFALVHLVTVPAPHRLLVFFPGLVFAWLAERSRSSVAAAVHHALCNVTLQLLQRLYG